MKILIIKLSAIGDVIHTLPALELLKHSFPESRITWVVEERAAGIVNGHPALDKIIVSRRKQWLSDLRRPSRWYPALKEIRFFLKELRETNYDLVMDFQGLLKSAVLVLLSRGMYKVGYAKTRELSYLVLNHTIDPPPPDTHAVTRNMGLVRALPGLPLLSSLSAPDAGAAVRAQTAHAGTPSVSASGPAATAFTIATGEADRRTLECLLQDAGVSPAQPLVVVNAPAGWETKRWEIGRMAALADLLIDRYHAQVIYSGARHDADYIRHIISCMKKPALNAAGLTTLKELACLMERADLLITTDSGPMHLASALGTPLVALFGPTAPWRTGPYGGGARIVQNHVWCSPCFRRTCASMICMRGITVDDVIESVEKIIAVRQRKGVAVPQKERL